MLKKLLFSIALLCFISPVQAQNCDSANLLTQGTNWELTHFNKKGKKESSARYEVSALSKIPNGLKWTLNTSLFDKKGKQVQQVSYELECVDSVYKFDMRAMLDPNALKTQEGMDVEVTTQQLEFPARLSAGTTLPKGSINIKTRMGQMTLMNMRVETQDRKVEAEEDITVAAGTYKTFRISQTTLIDAGLMKKEAKSVDYYLPGFGVIKSISLDKKGNPNGHTELTALNKG